MSEILFSESYANRLLEAYPSEVVNQLTDPEAIRSADLPHQDGETIEYVRLNAGEGRPIVYVPGFTEGIVAKAPFAADMASRGFDITLPDQNRKAVLKDAVTGRRGAAYSQAKNYLSVMHDAELTEGGVDFVAHSYGALILNKMMAVEPESFEDSRVVMLAPAGFSNENPVGLGYRFAKMLLSERTSEKTFPDTDGEMFAAGSGHLKANVPRALYETLDLTKQTVDYEQILDATGRTEGFAGRLAVVSYVQDKLYSQEALGPIMQKVVAAGGSWSVPVSLGYGRHSAEGVDIEGATHNDEQFNPSRVAGAVEQLLRADSFAPRGR